MSRAMVGRITICHRDFKPKTARGSADTGPWSIFHEDADSPMSFINGAYLTLNEALLNTLAFEDVRKTYNSRAQRAGGGLTRPAAEIGQQLVETKTSQ
ncbi:MAG: hypothetical protein M1820_010712 [Bogoriella megaspora]|nr:MAG: hypothetical protein M1820_010712 [Bogoriella megaspora]